MFVSTDRLFFYYLRQLLRGIRGFSAAELSAVLSLNCFCLVVSGEHKEGSFLRLFPLTKDNDTKRVVMSESEQWSKGGRQLCYELNVTGKLGRAAARLRIRSGGEATVCRALVMAGIFRLLRNIR